MRFAVLLRGMAVALACCLCFPGAGVGQSPATEPVTNAAPGSELQVFLLTMGQGDQVWEKFGHNAIWIHDPVRGTDWTYNYGVFDFNSPGYWSRFLEGNWIYQIARAPVDWMLENYRLANRSIWVQELNLLPEQKRELQEFLEWNMLPGNQEYRYDYFRDNCSTRVRDALDMALGGQIRSTSADSLTDKTFRWHSRRLIAEDELAYSGMNAGLGPAADERITAWQEMFIPTKLQEHLRGLTVRGADGGSVPLVASERQLFQAFGRDPERQTPPAWTLPFLAAGLLLGALLLGLAWLSPRAPLARWAFAAVGSLTALLVGTGGWLLVALWTLTDHSIAYRNENLLQFNPLAIALVVLLPALAYGAQWAAKPAMWIAAVTVGFSVLDLLWNLLSGTYQVNGEMVAFLLPVHLAVLAATVRLRRQSSSAPRVRRRPSPRRTLRMPVISR